jgi:hypothetical protein
VQIVLCSFRVLENTGHRCIVGVSSHQLTVGTLTQHMQGYSSRGVARINAIESRQDILDGQISSVLAKVDANTDTLSELKTLLHKFMGSVKVADIGSPSESKSVVEQRNGAQVSEAIVRAWSVERGAGSGDFESGEQELTSKF